MTEYIFTGLAPNTQSDDVRLALKIMLRPWSWFSNRDLRELEKWFIKTLPVEHVFLFASGRGALRAILNTLDLQPKDEVLLQAYTCIAVPGSIIAAGGKPVYIDIDPDTLNMSPVDLEKKISVNSRALIIQHTFGAPANLEPLLKIAQKYHLFVIEDCAHALGVKINNRHLGTFGDAAFFSFGRDKSISSVFGGVAVTNDNIVARKLTALRSQAVLANRLWVLQQLLHPLVTQMVKKTYNFGAGKVLLKFALWLNIISKAVYKKEKLGGWLDFADRLMPGALAKLAVNQLNKLETFNRHRRQLKELYDKALKDLPVETQVVVTNNIPLIRYTIFVDDGEKLLKFARTKKVFLGDWYNRVLSPPGARLESFGYRKGMCPVAEARAKMSVNLPLAIDIQPVQAERIIKILRTFYNGN